MTRSEILHTYETKTKEIEKAITQTKSRARWLLTAELASVAVIVASAVGYTIWHHGLACIIVATVAAITYLMARHADVGNSELKDHFLALLKVYKGEMAYMEGDFGLFRDGEQYIDAHHDFSFDLDVFGKQSLFHRINRTITSGGSIKLAQRLQLSYPLTISSIESEREAINELSEMVNLRMEFMALAGNDLLNTAKIIDAMVKASDLQLPWFASSKGAKLMAAVSAAIMIILTCASAFGPLASSVPLLWGLMQFCLCLSLSGKHIGEIGKVVEEIDRQNKSYAKIMKLVASTEYRAKLNRETIETLASADGNAMKGLKELAGIIDALDRRGHGLYMLVTNCLLLNDLWLVCRFAKWKQQYLAKAIAWIDMVSNFDARVSMATFRYNEPRGIDADICASEELTYVAEELYHPFLGDKAITNDFCIKDSNYYIVTGANMAGKSTFLRALGINYILALCGMPVFATGYRVSLFSIFSSMRTSDDLAHGISYFNAELLRLQQLITTCQQNKHTLIILDEILKGTNSADKLNGSRMFLEAMAELPVTGIIATHDLELSKMADHNPQRFHNYCFEINLSKNITYTYKIQEGVARNQNATYLLKKILTSNKGKKVKE